MPTRASDRVTLAVVASPTYVRTYYRMQASNLSAPAVPTTNPPASPWSTTEPAYTAGSTDTLYTVQLIAYGSAAFEYGPVQKSSAYEAAKQAWNLANQANQGQAAVPRPLHGTAVPTTNSPSAPNFSVYYRHEGSVEGPMIASYTRWNGAWVETPLRISAGQIIGGEVIGLTLKTAPSGPRVEVKTDSIEFYGTPPPAGEPEITNGAIYAFDNGAAGRSIALGVGLTSGARALPGGGSTLAQAEVMEITDLYVNPGRIYTPMGVPLSVGIKGPWVRVTPQDAGWNVSDQYGYRGLSVIRIGDIVRLSGIIRRSGGPINTGFFGALIPDEFRPAMREYCPNSVGGSGGRSEEVTMQPTGRLQFDVSQTIPTNALVFINAIWTLG